MSQSRKRRREETSERERLLASLQKTQAAASQWLPLFQPPIQQLLLCQQEWSLDIDEEEKREQVIACGLLPARLLCKIHYRHNTGPATLHFTLNSGFPSARRVQPPTLRDWAALSLIKQALRNSYKHLYTFEKLAVNVISTLPLDFIMEADHREFAINLLNQQLDSPHGPFQDMVKDSEEYWSVVRSYQEGSRKCDIPRFMCNLAHQYGKSHARRLFTLRNRYESMEIKQPLPLFSSNLSPLTPLSLRSASHLQLDYPIVLVKLSLVLCKGPDSDYRCIAPRITPLTPTEHALLQKQPRFDGQLPCVLPYGCVLC